MDPNAHHAPGRLTSRFFASPGDLREMQDMLMEGRSLTDDWRYPHVGDLAFAFFMVSSHLNPREFIRLWHDGPKLVGYAVLSEDPAFDFHFLPKYEWHGIENEALAWAESCLAELREHDAQRWGEPLVCGSRQNNGKRIAFLEEHRFRAGGQFAEVNMLCPLTGSVPENAVPTGWAIRALADAHEIPERASAHREVWHPWTVGSVTDEDYARLMQLPAYDRDLDVIAVRADGCVGAYTNGWIDRVNQIGDFGPVGARPAYRRQGLARAVLLECLRRMQARGMTRVSVSALISNTAARRLYESVGFRIANTYQQYIRH